MRRICDQAPCLRCGRPMIPDRSRRAPEGFVRYGGKGYCKVCWTAVYVRVVPETRTRWRRDDLLDEWDHLRRCGVTLREACLRLGISYVALDMALCRAKAAGDPRARRAA